MGAKKTLEEITLKGTGPIKIGTPHARVLIRDELGRPLMAVGATAPTDNDNGYAAGCIFVKKGNATGATGRVYINKGSYENCDFDAAV